MTILSTELDHANIGHIIFDRELSPVNVIDREFLHAFKEAVELFIGNKNCAGIILRSNKSTFIAGADLKLVGNVTDENAADVTEFVASLKATIRNLETAGIPVVACLAGSALGGGLEVVLGTHYRIALNKKSIKIGFPEVNLGLLPGGGGVARCTRMFGIEAAMPILSEGKLYSPNKALALGLIDLIVDSEQELISSATQWIQQNPNVQKPWDVKNFRLPGGLPSSPKIAQSLVIAPALIKKKTKGCLPAPVSILAAIVEGSTVSYEAAERIETRYFMELAQGQVAKNIIQTLFFQKNAIDAGVARPDAPKTNVQKVGILGAGMMGAGIAWACAQKNINVVLVDSDQDKAEKGKTYSESLANKALEKKRLSPEQSNELLARIVPTENYDDLKDCDLIIEAVFEDRDLKAQVMKQAVQATKGYARYASNTSTLPITTLAQAVEDQTNFVGIHFFSPVDKMPLVEIIRGDNTSDESVAFSFDFVKQLNKTPIVVNDGRGFFTSRVFTSYVYEGLAMIAEGISPAEIENAAWLAGLPVGPLAVVDEVSLTLIERIRLQTKKDFDTQNLTAPVRFGSSTLDTMLELGRVGKAAKQGFYDYPLGQKKRLWPGLKEQFNCEAGRVPIKDLSERLLYTQSLESIRAFDEGVLMRSEDANIGSIFGLGFPVWTGGVLQYINGVGLKTFVDKANRFAELYGERFRPPASLLKRAETNQLY